MIKARRTSVNTCQHHPCHHSPFKKCSSCPPTSHIPLAQLAFISPGCHRHKLPRRCRRSSTSSRSSCGTRGQCTCDPRPTGGAAGLEGSVGRGWSNCSGTEGVGKLVHHSDVVQLDPTELADLGDQVSLIGLQCKRVTLKQMAGEESSPMFQSCVCGTLRVRLPFVLGRRVRWAIPHSSD